MSDIEKHVQTMEHNNHNLEDIERAGDVQREKLRERYEKAERDESQRERDTISAKLEALGHAEEAEEASHPGASPAERRRGPITKKQLNTQFDRTMQQVQEELPAPSRAFSKFIHLRPIEKTSDFLGATIARPNALLAGAIGAFILTLAFYLFAKNMGYKLSGFETIATFALGWLIGLIYDYLRVMITGNKES